MDGDTLITVSYVDHMGDDLRIANAAWVSTDRWKDGLTASGEKLIHSLYKYQETTPFRHCQLSVRVSCPIVVARQLGKHQVGMSWSEESMRYLRKAPDVYMPAWRVDEPGLLQGSHRPALPEQASMAQRVYEDATNLAVSVYTELLDSGIARELARMVLPQGAITTYLWTGSLLSFAHVVHLRDTDKAQEETRLVAKEIKRLLEELWPVACRTLFSE